MIRLEMVKLPLNYESAPLASFAAKALGVPEKRVLSCKLVRRAVDARHKEDVHFVATLDVALDTEEALAVRAAKQSRASLLPPQRDYVFPKPRQMPHRPVVVGAGPAGLFCALTLARAGARPLLIERGAPVDERRRTVERFFQSGELSTKTNVSFGEGGAGTFSDGKLMTGIKNVRCRAVLDEMARLGNAPDILWQAKPHLGTDRLEQVVRGLRGQITALGGEVAFFSTWTGLTVQSGELRAIRVKTPQGEREIPCRICIAAIGHSARDTMRMLLNAGVAAQPKPFAVGVRIEHPREMIDRAQYGKFARHPALPAADYKLSCHLPNGRGVYTFCMCPGGVVIPAASEEGGVVTNGMSAFARDAENSNAALLCSVGPSDFEGDHPLAGITLQQNMERAAFRCGGGGYRAPVQRVEDFLAGRASTALGEVHPSYRPGVTPTDLRLCLPPAVYAAIREALPVFAKHLPGFDLPDAVLTGVETRSSSPVRFLRGEDYHSSVRGLIPCGEGAGYSGGIVSSAVDGIKCAEKALGDV